MKRRINYGFPVLIVLILILFAVIADIALMAVNNTQDVTLVPEDKKAECDFSTPWYEQFRVIAHALGTVDGRSETNSKEAFIESYERGVRIFEADMSLTADGYLVIRHDFTSTSFWNLEQNMDENMYYADYIKARIGYFYTPLDIDSLIALMKEYPDTYIVTDTKLKDADGVDETFRRFEEAIERSGDENMRQRFIIQIYDYDMYDHVRDIVPEGNIIFTLYQMGYDREFSSVADFCYENRIPAVAMDDSIADEDTVAVFNEKGIRVYVHTLNKIKKMIAQKEKNGVYGFYSDCITDAQLAEVLASAETEKKDDISYGEY